MNIIIQYITIAVVIIVAYMNKISKVLQKNYIYINAIMLFLALYIILFPIISIHIKKVVPQFNECTYLRLTGNPCPLCGGTRYIQNLPQNILNPSYYLNPFGFIMICVFLEIILRLYNFKQIKKKEISEIRVLIDIFIHMLLLIFLIIYEIIFLMQYGNY